MGTSSISTGFTVQELTMGGMMSSLDMSLLQVLSRLSSRFWPTKKRTVAMARPGIEVE